MAEGNDDSTEIVVRAIEVGDMENNVYVAVCPETRASLVIDACFDPDAIIAAIGDTSVVAIAQTHGHWDHVQALGELVTRLSIPVAAHPGDSYPVAIDRDVADGDRVEFGRRSLEVIHTPGHTPGSVCFLSGRHLFSGDTLFPGGPGNTWGDRAKFEQIIASVRDRLFVLPDDTRVYPGHGAATTIGAERPHLDEWIARGW